MVLVLHKLLSAVGSNPERTIYLKDSSFQIQLTTPDKVSQCDVISLPMRDTNTVKEIWTSQAGFEQPIQCFVS